MYTWVPTTWNTAIIRPTTVTGKSMVSKCSRTQEIRGLQKLWAQKEGNMRQTAMTIIVGHTKDIASSPLRPLGGFQISPGS